MGVFTGLTIAVAIASLLVAGPALAKKKKGGNARYCTSTALFQYGACQNDVQDDFLNATAICINVSDGEERGECFHESYEEASEAATLCREQRGARRDLCEAIGEDRYDPDFDPDHFEETFTDVNEFYPIKPGNHWEYANGDETVVVDVTSATKNIEDVTCIVVTDRVEVDGKVVEDTDDWFGQRSDGTIDYCGELSREFELFEGDMPDDPELVALEGSFKAGRDGAKPGTLFLGTPFAGAIYRQEWSPGDAEDVAEVLSTTYGIGADPMLDELVPPALKALMCSTGDCVVTLEYTPLSPGVWERKYYARGVGFFLETNPNEGEILQVTACNVDPVKCAGL